MHYAQMMYISYCHHDSPNVIVDFMEQLTECCVVV